MQISTREEDFVIDALELRNEMYILNESFTNPSIVKVILLICPERLRLMWNKSVSITL